MDDLIWFQAYSFNAKNGELIHRDGEGEVTVKRIPPQPAKLLWLLLDNAPEVVSHEQIRDRIWPEVEVDYEGSIHFCIRQIRSALDDSAADPKFVETIPRRGYRWIAGVRQVDIDASVSSPGRPERSKRERRLYALKVGLVFMGFLTLILWGKQLMRNGNGKAQTQTTTQTVRLGIMPFEPRLADNPWAGNSIGLQLLESVTNLHQTEPRAAGFEVIGPTSTVGFDPDDVRGMSDELKLDAILNGRFLGADKGYNMLVEIIRSSDGAHIWVKSYAPDDDRDALVREATAGVLEKYGSDAEQQ